MDSNLSQPVWENQFSTENCIELAKSNADSNGTDPHNSRRNSVLTPPNNVAVRRKDTRIAVKANGKILFTDVAGVVTVIAQGNYTLLQRIAGSYLVREPISAVADKLRPYGFIQIHRSVLVNSACVEEVRRHTVGEYRVRVKGGMEYTVTRTYMKNIQSFAELWVGM